MNHRNNPGKLLAAGLSISTESALIETDLFRWRFEVRKPDLLVMPPTAKQESCVFK